MSRTQSRNCCVVCGGNVMMPAAHLPRFPVFQGTVTTARGDDEHAPMVWIVCAACGSAQIETLPPHTAIYRANHATGRGETWTRHQAALAAFVKQEAQGAVIDIGGGNGALALAYRAAGGLARWTILEPNAIVTPDLPRDVAIAVGVLDNAALKAVAPRTAVLNHTLEHMPDLQAAVATLAACETLTRVILAWPVLERWVARGLAGALNFEHCTYVTRDTLIALFAAQGWHLQAEAPWRENDTAFMSLARGAAVKSHAAQGSARETIDAITAYYAHFQISALQIDRAAQMHAGDVFLMPASVNAQALLANGLKETRFRALLDDAPQKQGARLYGTGLEVRSPAHALADATRPLIVVHGGVHASEIVRGLKSVREDAQILKVAESALTHETVLPV